MTQSQLSNYYYYLIEVGEAIDKALMQYGLTDVVRKLMRLYNEMEFMVELEELLWRCKVEINN